MLYIKLSLVEYDTIHSNLIYHIKDLETRDYVGSIIYSKLNDQYCVVVNSVIAKFETLQDIKVFMGIKY